MKNERFFPSNRDSKKRNENIIYFAGTSHYDCNDEHLSAVYGALDLNIALRLAPYTGWVYNRDQYSIYYIADFGIVGAKFVLRVLAEHGFTESAFRIFTQDRFPGWCKWSRDGETTLLEDFAGKFSHCHIMFGDLSAWMMQYAAGLESAFPRPGFCEVVLKPRAIASLDSVNAWHGSIYGSGNGLRLESRFQP